MHGPLRLGLPTVDLHATFAAPCRLGETLEIAVAHGEVGGASVVLTATVTVAAAPRFAVTLKPALMDLDNARPVPRTPEWRARQACTYDERKSVGVGKGGGERVDPDEGGKTKKIKT